MKKIAIILFLFIVSISVFAQDKSLFTGNFSLTEYSKANKHSLFNPYNSFPSNHLFYSGKKGHSREHQAFHILWYHKFTERTKFLGASTVKNRSQNWWDVYNLIYVQRKNISSEEKPGSLAEGYLRRLAERSKKSRKTWGTVGLIGGGICLGLGAAAMSSAEEEGGWEGLGTALAGIMLVSTGVVGVLGGTLSLAIPSGAEREHKDVLRISDPAQRERASHEALSSLASRAKKWRIIGSAVYIASAVYFIVRDKENFYPAATLGGFAAYDLLRKTRAERAYQNYLKEKEYRRELALSIGIMPYGGVKIGLAFSF